MKTRKMILIVVILAIIAMVTIPVIRGKVNKARWLKREAKMMRIANAIREYHRIIANPNFVVPGGLWVDESCCLGFQHGVPDGNFFTQDDIFSIKMTSVNPLEFMITWKNPNLIPTTCELIQQDGHLRFNYVPDPKYK